MYYKIDSYTKNTHTCHVTHDYKWMLWRKWGGGWDDDDGDAAFISVFVTARARCAMVNFSIAAFISGLRQMAYAFVVYREVV